MLMFVSGATIIRRLIFDWNAFWCLHIIREARNYHLNTSHRVDSDALSDPRQISGT